MTHPITLRRRAFVRASRCLLNDHLKHVDVAVFVGDQARVVSFSELPEADRADLTRVLMLISDQLAVERATGSDVHDLNVETEAAWLLSKLGCHAHEIPRAVDAIRTYTRYHTVDYSGVFADVASYVGDEPDATDEQTEVVISECIAHRWKARLYFQATDFVIGALLDRDDYGFGDIELKFNLPIDVVIHPHDPPMEPSDRQALQRHLRSLFDPEWEDKYEVRQEVYARCERAKQQFTLGLTTVEQLVLALAERERGLAQINNHETATTCIDDWRRIHCVTYWSADIAAHRVCPFDAGLYGGLIPVLERLVDETSDVDQILAEAAATRQLAERIVDEAWEVIVVVAQAVMKGEVLFPHMLWQLVEDTLGDADSRLAALKDLLICA